MFELTVTARRSCQIPTVFFQKFNGVLDFHKENNKVFAGPEEDA
jgi:hypothetical protein